jgi:hypothetical protein
MILLSPWAAENQVSHEWLDHSSIPAFAAKLFNLPATGPRTDQIKGFGRRAERRGADPSLAHEEPYARRGCNTPRRSSCST